MRNIRRLLPLVFLLVVCGLAVCSPHTCPPLNVTCAEDGLYMYYTGHSKVTPAGHREYEFSHIATQNGKQVRHTTWVVCDLGNSHRTRVDVGETNHLSDSQCGSTQQANGATLESGPKAMRLQEIKDQSYDNKSIVIDGKNFQHCTFNKCKIIYRGGPARMISCYVGPDCTWLLEDAAFCVSQVLSEIGWKILPPPPVDVLQNPTEGYKPIVASIQIHKTLRTSPAMAAGVTDRLWDVNDLVVLWERYEQEAKSRAA